MILLAIFPARVWIFQKERLETTWKLESSSLQWAKSKLFRCLF